MSALFGHRKGSFTGANTDRQGLLRRADGGVLFLDEIGELGPEEQAMLLRAMEEKTFLPMGSDREVHVDFQLLAGTNKNLGKAVTQGEFRHQPRPASRMQLVSISGGSSCAHQSLDLSASRTCRAPGGHRAQFGLRARGVCSKTWTKGFVQSRGAHALS